MAADYRLEICWKRLENEFGTFEEFKARFSKAAATQFGSGWAWHLRAQRRETRMFAEHQTKTIH